MNSKKTTRNEYQDYSEFWNSNLQKLEEIHKTLDRTIFDLEKKYSDIEGLFNSIEKEIDILSSIYASYNSIAGSEYIQKLNAVIKEYKNKYSHNGIDFDVIDFLISKISELRNTSFEHFPKLDHERNIFTDDKNDKLNYTQYNTRPYKWITFERNDSWFISPFEDVAIINNTNCDILMHDKMGSFTIKHNKQTYKAKDIFAEFYKQLENPNYFIIINNGNRVFVASKIGKKVYSKTDFISKRISFFAHPKNISPGRLRIFGKSHIYIK